MGGRVVLFGTLQQCSCHLNPLVLTPLGMGSREGTSRGGGEVGTVMYPTTMLLLMDSWGRDFNGRREGCMTV